MEAIGGEGFILLRRSRSGGAEHEGHSSAPHMHVLVRMCSDARQFCASSSSRRPLYGQTGQWIKGSPSSAAPCPLSPALFRCLAIQTSPQRPGFVDQDNGLHGSIRR